jgi:O-antigen ligase
MAVDRSLTPLPYSASPRRRATALLTSLASFVSVEGLLIFWFVASPVASFYLRFPIDKSLVTFNRGVIALAVMLALAKAWANRAEAGHPQRPAFTATKFEISWAALAAMALINATFLANDFPYALKLAVDTFGLPLVVFHLARYHFDARGRGGALLIATAALAWCLFATGAFEFLIGTNLFPYKGSELIREGERRVNGPFIADSSFAIICLFVFVLLQAAPALFRLRMDRAARFFTTGAIIAAAAAALLPMFRSAVIALVACWLIVYLAAKRKSTETQRQRVTPSRFTLSVRASVIALIVLAVIGIAAVGLLSSNKRLTDPRNFIGRLATWESAVAITADHPLLGVGLSNYQWAFDQRYFWSDQEADELLETAAVDSPHSNLLWVAAEMGVFAFLFYVVANAYLLLLGWRAWRRATSRRARVAAAAFIALFVAYWLPGLTLASGYYSDTNLYFFFLLGLLSNESLISSSQPSN